MPLDKEAAKEAIQEQIANPLKTSLIDAACGIHDLINETMAAAAKTHIAEKGGNPNLITISAFGGAGPVHAFGLAKKIGAPRILVPPLAGVGSALGFFTAPVAFDLSRSHRVSLENAEFGEIESLFHSLETEGAAILQKSLDDPNLNIERTLMMRFIGQGAETDLSIDNRPFEQWTNQEIRQRFDDVYQKLYGRTYPETEIEFVTFKVRVSEPQRPFRMPQISAEASSLEQAHKGTRPAFCMANKAFVPHEVYDRMRLAPGAQISGPAIIEERESTIIVGSDASARVDEMGFVWIDL